MLELLLLCFAPGFSLVVPARRLAPVRCGILGAATLDVETLDASGGGVIKTALREGTGKSLDEKGAVAVIKYSARSGETLLASSDSFQYTVGDESWLRGWDMAVRSMVVGERARFTCDAENAYGAVGLPPVVSAGSSITFDVDVLDYRGNILTSATFASDKPLTPRTPTTIKEEFEKRREIKQREDAEFELQQLAAAADSSALDTALAPLKKLLATFQNFYFFGFFESATGEKPPWYLRPSITFPLIFLGVGISFYGLLQTQAILLRGDNSPIPGESPFRL